MELLLQGWKVCNGLTPLWVPCRPIDWAKSLPSATQTSAFPTPKGKPKQNRVIQECFQRHQMIEQVRTCITCLPYPCVANHSTHQLGVPPSSSRCPNSQLCDSKGSHGYPCNWSARRVLGTDRRCCCPHLGPVLVLKTAILEPWKTAPGMAAEGHFLKSLVEYRRHASPLDCVRRVSKG